ncbi:MAG TPA: tRNA (guanosine(37)-N1)-methyltransferase TrmD [Clostridiales bacterium]|nr:tRNA (guanosine(37)-N1)-methyltransferase TrmD [Clostridiales bacterium]
MIIDILTLFPDMFTPLKESVIGRAVKAEKVEIRVTDIRDYTLDKHKKCDDYTFGGGAGMVLMPQPVASAIEAIDPEHKARRIYMSPKGKTFTQKMVPELLAYDRLLLLCGHYEGVDQRVIDLFIDEEISIGDYVLTGGELPAMVVSDAVCRYIDGVLSNDSLTDETFTGDTLEYPQYTRPREFMGLTVPEVLLSGNHAEIDKWRKKESLALTKKMRPDLIKKGENE